MNLGVALTGGGGTRKEDDFYATPWEATQALVNTMKSRLLGRRVWEPACGDGMMARVLEANGMTVYGEDLVDRGYGHGGRDFLRATGVPMADIIITNPPFNLAEEFIRHALWFQPKICAMLLKANYWNAFERQQLFEDHPPARVMPLSWRLDFTGGGRPTMDCIWILWDTQHQGETAFGPILANPMRGIR